MTGSVAVVRYLSILMLGFTNFFMGWILPYSLGFVKLWCGVLRNISWVALGVCWVNEQRKCRCFIMGWL